MLPVFALRHSFNEFRSHEFGAAVNGSLDLGPQVESLHQIVSQSRARVLEYTVEPRRPNEIKKILRSCWAAVDDRYNEESGTFEHRQT